MKRSKPFRASFKFNSKLKRPMPMEPTMPPDEMNVFYENFGVSGRLDKAIEKTLYEMGWKFTGSGFAFIKNGTRDLGFMFRPWREDQIERREYARFRNCVYKLGNRRNDLVDLLDLRTGKFIRTVRIRSLKFDFWVKTINVKTPKGKVKK